MSNGKFFSKASNSFFVTKDDIELTGEIFFPNIFLERDEINFGCILNNTEVTRQIKMVNVSPLVVNYKWKFIIEKDNVVSNLSHAIEEPNQPNSSPRSLKGIDEENKSLVENQSSAQIDLNTSTNEKTEQVQEQQNSQQDEIKLEESTDFKTDSDLKINEHNKVSIKESNEYELPSIEEIFDISPLFGTLHSGESQMLSITYYGHKEIKAHVKAVCSVENGPDYELLLKGEASVLNYEISNKNIDFSYVVS